jgi:hypothetical protein
VVGWIVLQMFSFVTLPLTQSKLASSIESFCHLAISEPSRLFMFHRLNL